MKAVAVKPVLLEQEPPWVAWNRADSMFPFASYLIIFMLLAFAWGLSMVQGYHAGTDPANVAPDKWGF